MEGKRERGREKKNNPMNNSSALSAVVLSGRTTTNYFVLFASVSFALGKDIRNPPWLTKPADIRRDSLASRMKESSLPRKEKKKKATPGVSLLPGPSGLVPEVHHLDVVVGEGTQTRTRRSGVGLVAGALGPLELAGLVGGAHGGVQQRLGPRLQAVGVAALDVDLAVLDAAA